MSSIASFIKLPIASLDGLRQATVPSAVTAFLRKHGKPVANYQWAGFVLVTLLPCLEEIHEIQLMQSEHEELATLLSQTLRATCFVFTDTHRQKYLNRLVPASFSESKLRDFYNEFDATSEPEAGMPMLDGIRAIRQSLSTVDDCSVIIFVIA